MVFSVVTNSYLKGFMTGTIYAGASKNACVPGLSCYSCPGAFCACPIGAYQAVAGSRNFSVSLYVAGFLILVGGACGRFVCGWLCPFGLYQDLINRIPFKYEFKRIKGDRYLKLAKYLILVVFVMILPAAIAGPGGQGDPWFCKYVCPSGTLMAGMPFAALNAGVRSALGTLFLWKAALLAALTLLSITVYRPFCRYICPLGAVYGLFNKVSAYRYSFDEKICVGCGECSKACRLSIAANGDVNSADCIRCGRCLKVCRTGALRAGALCFGNKEKE